MDISKIVRTLRHASENEETLKVTYTNAMGITNEYEIWDIEADPDYGNGRICRDGYIRAYCGQKDGYDYDDYYTFKISRFESIEK